MYTIKKILNILAILSFSLLQSCEFSVPTSFTDDAQTFGGINSDSVDICSGAILSSFEATVNNQLGSCLTCHSIGSGFPTNFFLDGSPEENCFASVDRIDASVSVNTTFYARPFGALTGSHTGGNQTGSVNEAAVEAWIDQVIAVQ